MLEDINLVEYPGSQTDFSGYADSGNNPYNDYYNFILENTKYNNAWSAEQAQKQMDFQSAQAELERQYGSAEAAKNRDWQKMMSDTAHQREIADLKAAGLNPVLSAMNGNGAAVGSGASASRSGAPSGAKADADQSANNAIVSMLNSFLQAQTQLETARMSAQASMAVAEKYTSMERIIQEMKQDYGKWEHKNYPNNWFQVADSLIQRLFGDDSESSGKSAFSGRAGKFDAIAYREAVKDNFEKAKSGDKGFYLDLLKRIFLPGYGAKRDIENWKVWFNKDRYADLLK